MTVSILQLVARPGCRAIQDKWLFCLVTSMVALMAACWPEGLAHLRYDRSGLMDGEMWRLLTAHLVHLNLPHLLLNLFGLLLICELQWGMLPLRHGIGLFGFSGVAISACLWWLHPELVWYAGLSGVLHGLWMGCALYGLFCATDTTLRLRLQYIIGALLLVAKVLMEFYYGPSEYTANLIGGGVMTASHLYGALAGAGYVLTMCCVRICTPSRGALQQK
jgi:rhomboid family GlyGly-CTERM serine protease